MSAEQQIVNKYAMIYSTIVPAHQDCIETRLSTSREDVGHIKSRLANKKMNSYITKTIANSDRGLLLLLILPWLLLINNDAWIFDYHVMIDPWFYFGFFIRFKQLLEAYGDTYYASRMGWILPGHIAFKIFPPLVAQYLLHVGFYYLAVVSIYLLLRRTVGYRSALLASVMMGCHSWFLVAIGSNYVDGAGIAYYSSAAFMLILAAQEARWRFFLFLGGVFYGLAIYSNFSWLFLAPSLIFYYLFVNFKHQKNFVIHSGVFFILGLIATTVSLGSIAFATNGKFLFFLPSLIYLLSAVSSYKSTWDWLPVSFWLMLMTITFVSGGVLTLLAWLKKIPPIQAIPFCFQIVLPLSALPFLLPELKNQPLMLQYYYYASYLIPFTFIALGGQLFQLEPILNHLKRYQFWLIVASTVLLTLIAYQSSLKPLVLQNQANLQNQASLITLFFIALWLILMGSALLIRNRAKKTLSYALLILLVSFNMTNFVSIVCTTASITPLPYLIGKPLDPVLNEINFLHRRDAFLLNVDTQRYLETVDPKAQLMFWYDANEQWIYYSINQASLATTLSGEFPRIRVKPNVSGEVDEVVAKLERFPNIVILSQKSSILEQAQRSLKEVGFNANLIKVHDMKRGELSFRMTFIKAYKQNT